MYRTKFVSVGLFAGLLAISGLLIVGAVRAQSEARLAFEVATVRKINATAQAVEGDGHHAGSGLPTQFDHGKFRYANTLWGLILRAYGVRGCDIEPNDCVFVAGGPEWIKKDEFAIQATTPHGTPDYTPLQFLGVHGREGCDPCEAPQLQLMLQSLLADRFNLKLHREEEQLPVYVLTVERNGPKPNLKKAAGDRVQQKDGSFVKDTRIFFSGPYPHVHLTFKNSPIRELAADTLFGFMGRPVLDRTGLTGEFHLTLDYENDPDVTGYRTVVGATMIIALQEQLGLRLESTKAPVEVLVIDHAEQPSAN